MFGDMTLKIIQKTKATISRNRRQQRPIFTNQIFNSLSTKHENRHFTFTIAHNTSRKIRIP